MIVVFKSLFNFLMFSDFLCVSHIYIQSSLSKFVSSLSYVKYCRSICRQYVRWVLFLCVLVMSIDVYCMESMMIFRSLVVKVIGKVTELIYLMSVVLLVIAGAF